MYTLSTRSVRLDPPRSRSKRWEKAVHNLPKPSSSTKLTEPLFGRENLFDGRLDCIINLNISARSIDLNIISQLKLCIFHVEPTFRRKFRDKCSKTSLLESLNVFNLFSMAVALSSARPDVCDRILTRSFMASGEQSSEMVEYASDICVSSATQPYTYSSMIECTDLLFECFCLPNASWKAIDQHALALSLNSLDFALE